MEGREAPKEAPAVKEEVARVGKMRQEPRPRSATWGSIHARWTRAPPLNCISFSSLYGLALVACALLGVANFREVWGSRKFAARVRKPHFAAKGNIHFGDFYSPLACYTNGWIFALGECSRSIYFDDSEGTRFIANSLAPCKVHEIRGGAHP
jgi:hypothetical protein